MQTEAPAAGQNTRTGPAMANAGFKCKGVLGQIQETFLKEPHWKSHSVLRKNLLSELKLLSSFMSNSLIIYFLRREKKKHFRQKKEISHFVLFPPILKCFEGMHFLQNIINLSVI